MTGKAPAFRLLPVARTAHRAAGDAARSGRMRRHDLDDLGRDGAQIARRRLRRDRPLTEHLAGAGCGQLQCLGVAGGDDVEHRLLFRTGERHRVFGAARGQRDDGLDQLCQFTVGARLVRQRQRSVTGGVARSLAARCLLRALRRRDADGERRRA